MTKPSVRQNILLRSVQHLVADGEQVHTAVMMSTRHRWFLPYALAAGVGVGIVAAMTGLEGPLNWILFGAIGGAIAGMATTNYSVLAKTTSGLMLCRSSRVRQYAKSMIGRLPDDTPLTMVGSTVISSDWEIDGVIYSMTKRWEATMREMSMKRHEPR
jgi:hypothetical protein